MLVIKNQIDRQWRENLEIETEIETETKTTTKE